MRLAINLILILMVFGLIYLLINSIKEPISFQAEKAKREKAVINKLMNIRSAQELHRSVNGKFANNYDSLRHVINTGKIQIISVTGDPDDPSNSTIIYDTTFEAASDKAKTLGIRLDSMEYVPYGNGEKFSIQADTMTYQKTLVNVVEVGTTKDKFMGKFADARYARYDDSYDPNAIIKFGSLSAPNLSGNWE